MRATEERNKPVDGRDVARRLSETGALDGLFEQIDSGEARDDRGPGAAPRSAPRRFRGRGLRAELTEHLGYEKGEPTTSARGNARNGTTTKTIDSPGGPLRDSGRPPGPGRLVHAAPGSAKGQRRTGRVGRDDHRFVRRGDDRARDPPPLGGPPSARVPGQGDDLQGHRRGAPVPSWSGSAGLRVAFYPVIRLDAIRVKVRADHRVPGTPEPASPWARGMDGVKHVLGIWIQDGEGASLKGAACAPIWPTGAC